MALRDEDGWYRSGDGQKHESHFHANQKDIENDKIFREVYGSRKVDLRGNVLQLFYLVGCLIGFLFCQFIQQGLGYFFLVPAAWGLYALTKFVNTFTQEQRDRVFFWSLIIFLITMFLMLAWKK